MQGYSVSVLNLWWNGYALNDQLTFEAACVGFSSDEKIDADEDLTVFLTVNDRKGWECSEQERRRKSSFEIRLESFQKDDESSSGSFCQVS